MTPSVGRTVLVKTMQMHNGLEVHPAVITRVWNTNVDADAGLCGFVNTKVFPDCAPVADVTSIGVYDTLQDGIAANQQQFAFWPPRT